MPNIGLERHHQKRVAQYLNMRKLLWCHLPNEGKRSLLANVELKRQGLLAGMPDNLIFTPCPAFPQARGVAFELKREDKSASPTILQLKRLDDLKKVDWITGWFRGSDDAIKWIKELGW